MIAEPNHISFHEVRDKPGTFSSVFRIVVALGIIAFITTVVYDEIQYASIGCKEIPDESFNHSNAEYCDMGAWHDPYSDYEVAEDQFKIEVWGEEHRYKWSEENGTITVAWLDPELGDTYYCEQYVRKSAMPENWTPDYLLMDYGSERQELPSWCFETHDNSEVEFTPSNSAPFDGEILYKKEFADDDYPYIWWIQYTADGKYIIGEYGFEYEQDWLDIFCIAPFLLLFLVPIYLMVFARGRIQLLTLDFNTNLVKVEPMTWTIFGTKTATMSTPFNLIVNSTSREVHHSEAGDEHSSGRSWTTYHDGYDMLVALEGHGHQAIMFLETKNLKQDYGDLVGQLAFVAGIDDPLNELSEKRPSSKEPQGDEVASSNFDEDV